MESLFFKQFLMLTDIKTFIFIALLAGLFFVMHQFSKNKVSFASRVMLATGIGLLASTFTRSQIAALFFTMIASIVPAVQFAGMLNPVSSLEGAGRIVG